MRISCQGRPITIRKREKSGTEANDRGRGTAGVDETTLPGPKPERLRQCTRVQDTGGVFPAFAPALHACYAEPPHASKMVRERAHVSTICVTPPRHRAVDPGVRFRQTGRRGPRR